MRCPCPRPSRPLCPRRRRAGWTVAGRPGGRRGAAAVELALLLPFLFFIFLVAVDFGRIFYVSLTLANCARNGAYYASAVDNYAGWEGGGSAITSVQQATLADGARLNPPLAAGNVTVTNGTDAGGNAVVTVTVKYDFKALSRFPGIPSVSNLSRSAQARVAPAVPK